ncbi:hypothetical protein UFOVP84_47 [uncultured Caudovirales phage]|uniref:Uncharacterized protein n=1 Tax=uncultured Caudovirales phage TaxID=2100421 RepID=A0A6J5L3E0_9CAUD|nr:hypothetical protein UFOVP84_47 [uncultured Caudovirales phage]
MYYSQFSKKLQETVSGTGIQECTHFYSNTIQRTIDNTILINNEVTQFKNLSEAKNYIKYSEQAKDIINNLREEFFSENISKIADIIKEEHNIKVTNKIVEQYIKIASDKSFSTDPVISKIREMNEFDSIINGKLHYVLEDESVIAIDTETHQYINNLLENKPNVVEFMKESSTNFLNILEVLIKE